MSGRESVIRDNVMPLPLSSKIKVDTSFAEKKSGCEYRVWHLEQACRIVTV
ncbi:MAG: hypothetical protein Q4E24_03870 [bacterium]|nr:hypothetical protein [bacterium]